MRALHFIIVRGADGYETAGQYRVEQNVVRDTQGRVLYMPPHETEVRALMDNLLQWMRTERQEIHPLVLAAVAHAEFINIHPFDDGNGRVGRALTSYLLMRSGWRLRGFVRAEQVFGTDVEAYYAQLRKFGERYPARSVDFTEWAQWFLSGLRWWIQSRITDQATLGIVQEVFGLTLESLGIPRRSALALLYISLFESATSDAYSTEASVSHATAVSDLNALVRAGYLRRDGAGRATRYVPGPLFPASRRHAPTSP
ncbi:MAG: Fic family protein [Dehalococcoidia bacterium]|nr:Fic family protein [Dehalococcoidia bacterium]